MVSLTILPWHLDFATSQTMSKHTRGLWVFSKGSKSNSSRVQSPCFVQHVDNFLSKNPRPAESQSSHANISASASQICQKNKENAAWNPMLSNAPPGHPNVLTFSSPSSQHLALRFQEDIPWSSSTLKHLWHQTAPPHQQYLLQSVRILHVSCQNGKDGRGTERWKDGTQPHAHSGDGTSGSQVGGKVIHAKRQVSLTDGTENDAKKGGRFRFNRCLRRQMPPLEIATTHKHTSLCQACSNSRQLIHAKIMQRTPNNYKEPTAAPTAAAWVPTAAASK